MTSTRSSKWVLFSALQREGRRMSVWLALFPFLGFLYALCHGLLQALMNQDTDTVAAQDQTVRILLFAFCTVGGKAISIYPCR